MKHGDGARCTRKNGRVPLMLVILILIVLLLPCPEAEQDYDQNYEQEGPLEPKSGS